MPTPASSARSGSSSPSSHSFTTCPDDGQHISDIRIISHRSIRERIVHTSLVPSTAEASPPSEHYDTTLEAPAEVSDTSTRSTDTSIPADGLNGFTLASALTGLPSPDPSRADTESLSGRDTIRAGSGQDDDRDGGNTRSTSSDATQTSHLGQDIELSQIMSPLPGSCLNSSSPEFSTRRSIPVTPSSFLRPGSKFHGTQQSERQVYDVQVEIKFVDLRESFLCGYLRIQGLTEDHPTLTTYFEGEIIGTQYSFFTQHDDWGANPTVDLNHWGKFSPFRQFYKHAAKGTLSMRDVAQKENVFMRWKEHFLVPDHRVRTITGASFEGFYYICFNQVKGEVSGIYFHSKSEKFQQLELRHVPDKGCFSAMELR